jgi:hypothetical protein
MINETSSAVETVAALGQDIESAPERARMDETSAVEEAFARGRVALAERLEAAGGVWTTDEATTHLGLTRQTLQNWRAQRRVVALPRHDGSFVYPVAQFEASSADTGASRPYPAIQVINTLLADLMVAEELVAFLATPQEALSHGDVPRTPFAAMRDGATDDVLAMARWIAAPPDGPGVL